MTAGLKFGQNILDIILRFRTNKVALAANIEVIFNGFNGRERLGRTEIFVD